MGKFKVIQPRPLAALTLAGLVGLLGLGLWWPKSSWPENPLGDGWVRASYDTLHSLGSAGGEGLANSPVVIIYLDLHSYGQKGLNPAEPWPRDLHARLLQRLSAAKARAVVFDITFSAAGPNPAADDALARALQGNGRAILAAEFNNKTSHELNENENWTRSYSVVPPYPPFAQAAAGWGLALVSIDEDLVIRHHLAGLRANGEPSLAWATAVFLRTAITQTVSPEQTTRWRWVHYYGPALTIPHVSYSEALEPTGVPDEFFHDKIVFVGARPMENLFHERQDEFRSPFHLWSNKEYLVPGVEVHATQMLNLLREDWLRRLSPGVEIALLLGCAGLFGAGLVWLRPIPATIVSLGGALSIMGLAAFGFSRLVWFPWLIAAGAQIPAALGGAVLFYSGEWYRTRRRLEAAKRIADAKIREQAALIDAAHDAILVQDINGRVLYANPSAERLYGWKLADFQSDGAVAELFSPDPAGAARARSAAIAQGEWDGELCQQTRAGRTVIVASRWTLIRDEAGQPKALLLINSDVTGQKELEAQFLRTQRMNTIGTLAGGMAHDLNNALAPILMGVQLLRRKGGDEESSRLLGFMEANTNRGAEMVRQVLLFARGYGGEFHRLELGPLVKELEKMVRETFPKNITVETFLPADLWPVRGNPTQLHQVLLNLCVNARDAMPAGGRLSFAADNVELTAAEATAIPEATPGQFVSLLVSDTGSGMPPEVRARIFEPFFTTKGEGRGTGIGLSTVVRIVKSHGGFLRLESEPGQGTTFEVFWPRAADAPAGPAAAPAADLPRGHGELILVADDERAIRELVAEGLTAQGYRVITAADGSEAVRRFQEHARDVQLLLTDCHMPTLDGPDAIRLLREQRADLPVIIVSGEGGALDSPGAPLPPGAIVLRKPFALDELLATVGRCLSKPSSNSSRNTLGNP